MKTIAPRAWIVLTLTATVTAASLSLTAQMPASGAPAGQAPNGAAGQGGRGAGGRGGPNANDPINADVDYSKKPPVLPKTPDEELKQFILQPGYRLELVMSDPEIQEPAAIAFDGNGRMFVLEQRGYMHDADATGELDPVGRISLHTDTDNDGVYDKHTVFVDHLIFPRFVTPFGPNAILTKESNADEVWKFTDTNGDGVADKKELFDTGYGRTGNVEHQEAFLTWSMDNWMYSTYNAFRARWTPNGIVKETTGANGSAWGVTQDNDGKQWFQGGASGLPSYWQFPIVYGNFGGGRGASSMDPDLAIPWGAPIRIADMQGGMAVIRMPDGSLKSTTAGAGGNIYRGDRLPKDLVGDYFYGEQVARIVRRVRAEKDEGLTMIRNAYAGNEFLKSLDPYFRPVDNTTAPDGTMYIADMYHGIIQESQWTPRGSYLRAKIEQYDLDKVIHKGRIWRLVYDGVKRDHSDALDRDKTVPRMNNETAAQLVTHLAHPNGWWRDTAQQLLVLKQDKSVVPALQRDGEELAESARALPCDVDARRSRRARRRARAPADGGSVSRGCACRRSARARRFTRPATSHSRPTTSVWQRTPSVDVVMQSMLTMNRWKVPDATATIKAVADSNKARGVQTVASAVLNPSAPLAGGRGAAGGGGPGAHARTAERDRARRAIYNELCFTCHGNDGYGTPQAGEQLDDGTAAGRVAAREWPPRLRRQCRAARIDRADRRQELHRSHDSDGTRTGTSGSPTVASYVRNSFGNAGSLRDARRRRARARGDGGSQDAVDDR